MNSARLVMIFVGMAVSAWAAGFYGQLTPEQRRKLGLEQLSPQQVAELDAAVDAYRQQSEMVVAKQAAETAVAEYKKKEEPGVVSRALEVFKRTQNEAKESERITAVLQGRFTGWNGSTLFRLDNGQVWRQTASDNYHTKAKENVAVVIYKAGSGYWRLRILDDEGAWVTVKRVQ